MSKKDDIDLAKQLIERHGKIKTAAEACGVHYSTLGKIAGGKDKMSDSTREKIEAALAGNTVDGPAMLSADFSPKVKNGKGGKKVQNKYNDPPSVAELVAKYDGRRNRAAAMLGFKTVGLMNKWATEPETFDERAQRRVSAALRGEPPPSDIEDEEPDTYRLGFAVGLFPAANFERAMDAAEAFGGKCIFKASIRTEWLGIFKLASDRAKLWKKLMARDAIKITCP